MTRNTSAIWIEKYRPQTLDEYVFHDDTHQLSITKMVESHQIGHLLFSGIQGTGKTSLAQIIIRSLVEAGVVEEYDVLTVNASDESKVETIRDKIKDFISTGAMGEYKIVHLEEAEYISPTGQGVLRRMMEEYIDNARFILTCNYEHKIITPLRSRCQHFRFTRPDINETTRLAAIILKTEKIKFTLDLLDKYVSVGYPDIRKIINLLQQNSIDGQLLPVSEGETSEYKFELLDLISKDDWIGARELTCGSVAAEEWEDVYTFLYNNLHKSPKFSTLSKWEEGILVIADRLHKHALFSDPEINAAAMYIDLSNI